jgi:hypothetical protein
MALYEGQDAGMTSDMYASDVEAADSQNDE